MLLLCCLRSEGVFAVSWSHSVRPLARADLMYIHLADETARSEIVLPPGCLYPFDRRQYRTRNHVLWIKESAMPPGPQRTQH